MTKSKTRAKPQAKPAPKPSAIPVATSTPQKLKTRKDGSAVFRVASTLPPDPVPVPERKRRRRRRRSKSAIIAQRVIIDIKQKERQFLREVSAILTDALGFPVRVSHVKAKPDFSPDMRRASRMTKKEARASIIASFNTPAAPRSASGLNDEIPF